MKKQHLGRIHKCPLCEKSYTTNYTLKDHVAYIHRGEKNQKCDKCGRSFGYIRALQRHKKSTECKSFLDLDSKETINLPNTDQYIDSVKKFRCEFCQKAFGQKATLKKHISKIHGTKNDILKKTRSNILQQ